MAFDTAIVSAPRGRMSSRDRVSASRASDRLIRFAFSADIAARLGILTGERLGVNLGTGDDSGSMLLSPSSDNGLFVTRSGQQAYAQVRVDYLPNIVLPTLITALPHRWRGADLIVDLTPLIPTTEQEQAHD